MESKSLDFEGWVKASRQAPAGSKYPMIHDDKSTFYVYIYIYIEQVRNVFLLQISNHQGYCTYFGTSKCIILTSAEVLGLTWDNPAFLQKKDLHLP